MSEIAEMPVEQASPDILRNGMLYRISRWYLALSLTPSVLHFREEGTVLVQPERPKAVALIAVGRLREVLQSYLDQVPPGPYTVVGVTNSRELSDELAYGRTVGVLLGGGLDDEARSAYRTQIERSAPGLPIVDHFGGKDGFVSQLLGLLPADT